jgi:membrane associated rhomboid family serine protease
VVLPLGDAPNPRGVPLVTYALILANVAVYVLISLPLSVTAPDPKDPALLEYVRAVVDHLPRGLTAQDFLEQMSAYDLFVFHWGFRPAEPSLPNLFTSIFLHAGFLHLFGNMLFLWIYGDNVEHRLGGLPFLFWYLATGVAATLFHAAFDLGLALPLVGASGAISGVLGFYFLWFPRNTVRLLFLLFPFFMEVITVPARIVLGLYLIADNLLPFLVTRGFGGGGVAYGAHIGGFLAGLAVAWFVDRKEVRGRPAEYRRARADATQARTPSAAIADAITRGELATAAQLYFSLDPEETRRLLAPDGLLVLANWLRANGHDRAALTAYRRFLREYPHGPGAAEAHLGAGLVQLEGLGQLTPAYQHFLEALELDPSPETAASARAALAAIARRQKLQIGRPRRQPWG